ncbi:mitochondrial matrix iron-sulfur protein [Orbilia blumenaviensis]|uniref:Mitochondrial matrix iron-sulfur protein n=1 Tax=Orbilia blumenaviensis TaxID=1796055 RepID=A0AAV9UY59_9PEZI
MPPPRGFSIFRNLQSQSRARLFHTTAADSTALPWCLPTRTPIRSGAHSKTFTTHILRPRLQFPPSTSRRLFSTTPCLSHGHLHTPKPGEELKVTFVTKEGNEFTFEVAEGDNLLDIGQANDLEMEGACGGSCACSTCHVIVEDQDMYDLLEEPDDDENDMLDLAFGLTETSRLGCQVKMKKDIDGLKVKLPAMTRNLQASDFK